MNSRTLIILVVVVLAAVVGGVFLLGQSPKNNFASSPTADVETIATPGPVFEEVEEDEVQNIWQGITVIASEFKYSPAGIEANVGDTITLTLTNKGKMRHDLVIDELGVKTKLLSPGESQTIEFVVEEAGQYVFYCSIPGHRESGMEGKLVVN